MKRLRMTSVPLIVLAVVLASASCSDSGSSDSGGTPTASGAPSGCAEANALEDSLTALTQVDPVNDGVDALESAAAQVKTDAIAAASAVSAGLQPAVAQVKTALGGLEAALKGVSSAGGLGPAATQVGAALKQLGEALTGLSTQISQTC